MPEQHPPDSSKSSKQRPIASFNRRQLLKLGLAGLGFAGAAVAVQQWQGKGSQGLGFGGNTAIAIPLLLPIYQPLAMPLAPCSIVEHSITAP
ncbi:MAG: hypothetical protein MUF49_10170 [Oculatellaceae cyanobacterium Prado106]|nr:hypothetical protein [Oculatellaceae cyanobacterium Prado106]